MKIIDPSYEILTLSHEFAYFNNDIEYAGRTCYKSHEKITTNSSEKFVKKIIESGHHSVLEHKNISIKFIVSRGFTHELVRHRLVAYSQESTRYCNYTKDKFENEIIVIKPAWWNDHENYHENWIYHIKECEKRYFDMIEAGFKPQEARGVLPIDLKTEIVATTNIREWRHILNLRTANVAHPDMQRIMRPLCKKLQHLTTVLFDDISWE